MGTTIIDFYKKNISSLEVELQLLRKKISAFYLLRIFSFLLFFTFFLLYLNSNYTFYWIAASAILFATFIFAVARDIKLNKHKKFLLNKLQINLNEIKFLNHDYSEFDNGEKFSSINPHLADDFNLFGRFSLFQYLNRCSTLAAKKILAERLSFPTISKEKILENQEAIKELSQKQDFMHTFRAHGLFIEETGKEINNLKLWINENPEKTGFLKFLCYFLPALNIAWIISASFGIIGFNSIALPLIISLIFIFLFFRKVNKAHAKLSRVAKTFNKYNALINLIEKEEFKSEMLSNLQKNLSANGISAGKSLNKLFVLLENFDKRLNVFTAIILNAFLVFDLQIYRSLIIWKQKNKDVFENWFITMNEFEVLIGFSTYKFNNSNTTSFPTVVEGNFEINAVAMGHPLIKPEERICNDFNFSGKPKTIIVTGANMAGKSTFLRTVSVNLILAMNGMPVCAKEMRFLPCEILSSIKIQDSLSDKQSYFYSELLRIKQIIDKVKTGSPNIVILDEILRGTNTKDKQLGSTGLLEKLISLKAVVIIATHDLSLGDLEQKYPETVINKCFEVELENDRLVFDYKLKSGVSKKLNASFLMQKMELFG
ncbi:MAG: hypothetical protein JXR58_04760 [Bacteroidales bacterium]|nr:hypothetical protein [Bacteroidales bacterium]